MVCKLFFDPNSPIFWKTLAEKIKTDDSKVFCFTSKPKILMLKYFKIMFLQFTFDSGIIHLLSQRHSSLLRTTYVILGLQNAQRSYWKNQCLCKFLSNLLKAFAQGRSKNFQTFKFSVSQVLGIFCQNYWKKHLSMVLPTFHGKAYLCKIFA